MENGQEQHRWRLSRSIASVLAVNFGVAAAVVLFLASLSSHWRRRDFGRSFLISLIYSNSIGTLGWLVLPNLAPRFARHGPVVKWLLYLSTPVAVTAVGCALASVIFAVFGIFPPGPNWINYWVNARFALVISLVVCVGIGSYERLRARLEATTLELRTKELERDRK